jgi:hypothetical protein
MGKLYWSPGTCVWTYKDIASQVHGRVDWFEDINDMGYWWQTAHESGMCFALGSAKRCVEQALWQEQAARAARYAAGGRCSTEVSRESAQPV